MIDRELAQLLVAEFEGSKKRGKLLGAARQHVAVRDTLESHSRLWRMRHLLRAQPDTAPVAVSSHSAA